MEANEIIQLTESKYCTCLTYRDTGHVVFNSVEETKETLQFRTLFRRPDYLVFQFQDYGPARGKTDSFSTLWSHGSETWFRWQRTNSNSLEHIESLERGQAGAVGCSAGAAGIVPSALIPKLRNSDNRFLNLDEFQNVGTEEVFGIECYLIRAKGRRAKDNYLWISKSDSSLKKYYCDMSTSAAEMEAEIAKLRANTELMAMMKAKGIAPPENMEFRDMTLVSEYHFTETVFDEEFQLIPKPE